jgi:hypothetical protein
MTINPAIAMEITPRFPADYGRLLSSCEGLEWTPYRQLNPWLPTDDFFGIGLMNKKGSPLPLQDSLMIRQSIEPAPAHENADWQRQEEFNSNCRGYMLEFIKRLLFSASKAKVSLLKPGAVIHPHTDAGCESITRLHWVLQADDGNFFTHYSPEGKRISRFDMHEGRAYAIDPSIPHAVQYKGKTRDRIHLVVNCPMPFAEFREWVSAPLQKLEPDLRF